MHSRPCARAAPAAAIASAELCASISTDWTSSTMAPSPAGGWSDRPVALSETTERSADPAVIMMDETAGGPVAPRATSINSTPACCRSARMPSASGCLPTPVSRAACPPRCVNATAAFVAGPPAATVWRSAVTFSLAAGTWLTDCMRSNVHRPTNSARGSAREGLLIDQKLLRMGAMAARPGRAPPGTSARDLTTVPMLRPTVGRLPAEIRHPQQEGNDGAGIEKDRAERPSRPGQRKSGQDCGGERGDQVTIEQPKPGHQARDQPEPVVAGAQDADDQPAQQRPGWEVEGDRAQQLAGAHDLSPACLRYPGWWLTGPA